MAFKAGSYANKTNIAGCSNLGLLLTRNYSHSSLVMFAEALICNLKYSALFDVRTNAFKAFFGLMAKTLPYRPVPFFEGAECTSNFVIFYG